MHSACLKGASFGLMQRSKQPHYSITLSASPRSVAGISRPSAGLEVDHEFKLSRRLDPQLAGFVTFEDAASVETNWAGSIRQVVAVAQEAPGISVSQQG
jgi:hypothetical protein